MSRSMRTAFLASMVFYLVGYAALALFFLLSKIRPDEFFPGYSVSKSEPGFIAEAAGSVGFVLTFLASFVVGGSLMPADGERARGRAALGTLLFTAGLGAPLLLDMMRFWVLKAVLVGFPIGAVACGILACRQASEAEELGRVFE